MKKVKLLSIAVSTGSYSDFVTNIIDSAVSHKSNYTCVANVHMLVEAHQDKSFATLIRNALFITPDGKPLSWALRLLYGIKQDRVAGMDLLPDLLGQAATEKIPVFFYGGTNELLTKTETYLAQNFPGLTIAGMYSPPFRDLTREESDLIVDKINASGARLVFVVLGCPKQEKWIASMKGRIQGMMVAVGGALPVLVGMQKRAPKWMQDAGLEWLFRLIQEPKRLLKRYLVTNTKFVYLLTKEYLRLKISRS